MLHMCCHRPHCDCGAIFIECIILLVCMCKYFVSLGVRRTIESLRQSGTCPDSFKLHSPTQAALVEELIRTNPDMRPSVLQLLCSVLHAINACCPSLFGKITGPSLLYVGLAVKEHEKTIDELSRASHKSSTELSDALKQLSVRQTELKEYQTQAATAADLEIQLRRADAQRRMFEVKIARLEDRLAKQCQSSAENLENESRRESD